ncbi:MAG TPA: glycerate kinase [Candidatus Cloacimonadota bacterium]|nr:glycerate kinase [Candidatus Cloacimonadota bacterium]
MKSFTAGRKSVPTCCFFIMNEKQVLIEIATQAIKKMDAGMLLERHISDDFAAGRLLLIAIGKAAWQMANTAYNHFGSHLTKGIVITKYGHSQGKIGNLEIYEAGHPLPDENSLLATKRVLELAQDRSDYAEIIFLVSGGGSALFENPLPEVTLPDLIEINTILLNCGANINEINTVRKHLSSVKGGRFAQYVAPLKIHCFMLSDVVGDEVGSIASGPAVADVSTSEEALRVLQKYHLPIAENILNALRTETPKFIDNTDYQIIGNVQILCQSAATIAQEFGYQARIVRTNFCEDVEMVADHIIAKIQKIRESNFSQPLVLIFGGEPTVQVHGKGKGGRNQHLALLMAQRISGMNNIVFLSLASDGTDGPTDAAGGVVDGSTYRKMTDNNWHLAEFDSYNILQKIGCLIKIGATGTNVNDLMLVMINPAPSERF